MPIDKFDAELRKTWWLAEESVACEIRNALTLQEIAHRHGLIELEHLVTDALNCGGYDDLVAVRLTFQDQVASLVPDDVLPF